MNTNNDCNKLLTGNHNFYPLIASVILISFLCGCASVNKGDTYSSGISGPKVTYSGAVNNNAESLLVVIRFPAFFSDKAFDQFSLRYASYPLSLSGKNRSTSAPNDKSHSYANEAINKTAYFALEFYHGLSSKLPPDSVILQPLEVDVDSIGRIVSKPVNAYPPSVLFVDFFVYRAPARDITKEIPLTFGDLVSPLITIKTAPDASPITLGVISYVEPLAPFPKNYASVNDDGRWAGHTFIKYLSNPNRTGKPSFSTTSRQPRARDKVLRFPLVNLRMNGYAIKAQANTSTSSIKKSQFLTVINPHLNAIIDALNTLDHSLATRTANRRYIELYDSELASICDRPNLSREDDFKLQLINKFKSLERKFLAEQSEEDFKQLYLGSYGKSVRKLMAAEVKYISKVRHNTSEANETKFWKNTAFAMNLAANFLSGLSGQPLDNSKNVQTQELINTQDAMIASYESENRELTEAFQENFSKIYLEQTKYRTIVLDGEKVIHAKNLSELREKLRSYYNRYELASRSRKE